MQSSEITGYSTLFLVKKWVPLLFVFVVAAIIERYFWSLIHGPTADLMWYINPGRNLQLTHLGIDKAKVAYVLDLFHGENLKILVAAIMSGTMFSLAVFSSNRNRGFKKVTNGFILIACLLLLNKYIIQLDMHLWRQQISFYAFIISINQTRTTMKAIFAAIAVFFHEVTILLFALYLFSMIINFLIKSTNVLMFFILAGNTILFFTAFWAGYYQISVISVFCQIMILANKHNEDTRRTCTFIVALGTCSLLIFALSSNFGIGPASAERLVILSVMSGLFMFFVTNASSKKYASTSIKSKDRKYTKLFGTETLTFIKMGFLTYYAFI